MDKIGRIYKGEDFDLEIKVPISGDIFVDDLRLYTDCNISFRPQNITVSGNTIKVHCEDHDLDLLNDGVLKYYLKYQNYVENVSGGNVDERIEDIINTNTMHYLKTSEGYDAITPEDIYNWGKQAQKDAMTEITITQNGTYTREDGYSAVTVNIPTTGYTEEQVLEAYNNGYNTGEAEGEITGAANQKALLSAITITENGTYTRENGYSAVTVDVESSGTPASPYIAIANITGNGIQTIDSMSHILSTPDDWEETIHYFSISGTWPVGDYQVGEIRRRTEYIEIGINNGRLYYDDWHWDRSIAGSFLVLLDNGRELRIETNEKAYFDDYTQDDEVKDGTYPISGVRINTNVPQSGTVSTFQDKNYEITGNGYTVITPDSGYDGITGGTIHVNVTQTGHTDAELETAYNSGYSAGIAAQKALMVGLTATTNGTYTREDGYSSVYVNVSGSSSGTPSGVTVDDEFYFEARENNSKLTIAGNIAYSTDKTTWNTDGFIGTTLTLNSGEKVYLKALSGFTISQIWPTFQTTAGTFNIGGKIGYFVFGDSVDGHALTSSIASLFAGSTGIVDASNLKLNVDFWTNNIQGAFGHMFSNCSLLINTPLLTATTLTNGCYGGMFEGCNSLQTAPALPATTLAPYCYASMFCDCVSLVTAPALPVTTLAEGCYGGMFRGCTALHTAPALPATTLVERCYEDMFDGCTSLTTPPDLPATTLASFCYGTMFMGCTSLTTAPELPASTLVYDCYYEMFHDCSNLSSVKVLANMWETYKYSRAWLTGVASAGTFTKLESTYIQTDNSGIPDGWTVVNI